MAKKKKPVAQPVHDIYANQRAQEVADGDAILRRLDGDTNDLRTQLTELLGKMGAGDEVTSTLAAKPLAEGVRQQNAVLADRSSDLRRLRGLERTDASRFTDMVSNISAMGEHDRAAASMQRGLIQSQRDMQNEQQKFERHMQMLRFQQAMDAAQAKQQEGPGMGLALPKVRALWDGMVAAHNGDKDAAAQAFAQAYPQLAPFISGIESQRQHSQRRTLGDAWEKFMEGYNTTTEHGGQFNADLAFQEAASLYDPAIVEQMKELWQRRFPPAAAAAVAGGTPISGKKYNEKRAASYRTSGGFTDSPLKALLNDLTFGWLGKSN